MVLQNEEVFLIDRPDSDSIIVYAPLRNYLAEANKEFRSFISTKDGENQFVNFLASRELVDIDKIHNSYRNRTPFLSLSITDDCSLKCKYCYFRAGDIDKRKTMSTAQIKAYVDAYFKQLTSSQVKEFGNIINIAIAGGGEPTKEFERLKFAVGYIREQAAKYGYIARFTMPTNGFYGDTVRQFIVDNFYQVSLSMDGPADIQNYQRPTVSGAGSFDVVFDTAKYFYTHNFKFAFRSTISKYALHRMNDIIDFFDDNFHGISIAMERMSEFGRYFDSSLEAPTLSEFKDALTLAHQYAYKRGAFVKNASLGKSNSLRTVFCLSVAVPNWTILTDGRITSCTRDSFPEHFTFGKYDEETQTLKIDEEKVCKLRKMNVFNYTECFDCFAKYNCAGDCPNLRLAGLVDCDANRKLQLERFIHFLDCSKGGNQHGL